MARILVVDGAEARSTLAMEVIRKLSDREITVLNLPEKELTLNLRPLHQVQDMVKDFDVRPPTYTGTIEPKFPKAKKHYKKKRRK